jgi:hypothetical protein
MIDLEQEAREYREDQIDLMLSVIEQCYDTDCLKMATTKEYVVDAVTQLYDKGWRKDWPLEDQQND